VIYKDAQNEKSGYNKNPGMSLALVRNALDLMIDLSTTLKRDLGRQAKWKDILAKLSELPIQKRNGKTVFRGAEEDKDGKPVRGVSYSAIYPANAITLSSSKSDLEAAKNTISAIQRWDHHNSTNSFYMAAIRVGYDSLKILSELHKYAIKTYPNGFQLDNPHGIENACTVAGAVTEMLCMSVGNNIRLFNIWPKNLDAQFNNVRAWGAFLISAELSKGTISHVKIISERGKECNLSNPWPGRTVLLTRNNRKSENIGGSQIRFKTQPNEIIVLQPL
jgi:alpha-L-fucosidase 2